MVCAPEIIDIAIIQITNQISCFIQALAGTLAMTLVGLLVLGIPIGGLIFVAACVWVGLVRLALASSPHRNGRPSPCAEGCSSARERRRCRIECSRGEHLHVVTPVVSLREHSVSRARR